MVSQRHLSESAGLRGPKVDRVRCCRERLVSPQPHQSGLTLMELMVAMAISLVVTMAAASGLLVARQGFMAVDESSRLQDSTRFALGLLSRLVSQAGYRDLGPTGQAGGQPLILAGHLPQSAVQGYNNAVVLDVALPTRSDHGNRDAASAGCPLTSDTACVNGSDILILRHQASETVPGSGVADGVMINCAGFASPLPASVDDMDISVLHVARSSNGEPALMCSYRSRDGNWALPQPLVEGVESFQVLYGVGPDPSLLPPAGAIRFLRADEIDIPGDEAASLNQWRRVRSLRIGLVVRGPVARRDQTVARTLHPFGEWAATSAADDPGSEFNAPADGRLRQTAALTLQLRNAY